MRGRGFGVIGDLVVGIIGAIIGGYVLSLFGIRTGGTIGQLITSIIGAVILLFLVGLFTQSRHA